MCSNASGLRVDPRFLFPRSRPGFSLALWCETSLPSRGNPVTSTDNDSALVSSPYPARRPPWTLRSFPVGSAPKIDASEMCVVYI